MLLEIENLRVRYATAFGRLDALSGVTMKMRRGESFAVVGESGSGKSTLGLAIVRLLPPNGEYVGGSLSLDGRDVMRMTEKEAVTIRGSDVFMIFQDPLNMLNPVKRIREQMMEVLRIRNRREEANGKRGAEFDETQAREETIQKLRDVRISDPGALLERYPHQLSGGQVQRVVISMGLLLRPKLLIADEPTSALDATVQAQVLKLMDELRRQTGMAILFITHDISVANIIADNLVVTYAGEIAEMGPIAEVIHRPRHPYTRSLIGSIPKGTRSARGDLRTIPGSPPNLMIAPPAGCRFHPRCARVMDVCARVSPRFTRQDGDVELRCWLYG